MITNSHALLINYKNNSFVDIQIKQQNTTISSVANITPCIIYKIVIGANKPY